MTDSANTITVEDVRKLALPLGTKVISGDGLLNRPVAWTTVIYYDDQLRSKNVQPNEVILVSPPDNGAKPIHTDADIVRWAADVKAAAVVFANNVSLTAVSEAKAYNLPLLQLPPASKPRSVEKTIVSLLVDRKGHIERRGTQIYRQLTQISSQNEGMAELVNAMARLTNKTVVVQDKRLRLIEHTLQPQFVSMWEDIETFIKKQENLPVEMQDRHRVQDIESPVQMQSLPIPGIARLIAPIITNSIGRGFLSIIGQDNDLDDIDRSEGVV